MSSDNAGRGKIESATNSLRAKYGAKVIVIFTGYLSDASGQRRYDSPGVTSNDRGGFVTTEATWPVIAHEFGHVVIGTYHEFYPGNILKQGLSEDPNPDISSIWLSPWQVSKARNYITQNGLEE